MNRNLQHQTQRPTPPSLAWREVPNAKKRKLYFFEAQPCSVQPNLPAALPCRCFGIKAQ